MDRIHLTSFFADNPHGVVARYRNCTNADPVMVGHALYLPGHLRVCDIEATRQGTNWLMDVFVEPWHAGSVPQRTRTVNESSEPIRFASIGSDEIPCSRPTLPVDELV